MSTAEKNSVFLMLLSQPPNWWPTELVGVMVLIFPHFNHSYITVKQLKTDKCFFCYHFFIWAVATTKLMWRPVEPMGQSLPCCDVFDRKQASFYPGKGIQWFGMTKMVKRTLTPNPVINTYDCLLHRLSIFCLSLLPKYPTSQTRSQARVKRREDTNLRKQTAN